VIERSTMETLDRISDVVYRVALTLSGLVVVTAVIYGDWRTAVAFSANIGLIYCVIGFRDSIFERLDRWRDRKIAEIEAKYHPEDDNDGR
jgi:hypothetical protein